MYSCPPRQVGEDERDSSRGNMGTGSTLDGVAAVPSAGTELFDYVGRCRLYSDCTAPRRQKVQEESESPHVLMRSFCLPPEPSASGRGRSPGRNRPRIFSSSPRYSASESGRPCTHGHGVSAGVARSLRSRRVQVRYSAPSLDLRLIVGGVQVEGTAATILPHRPRCCTQQHPAADSTALAPSLVDRLGRHET